MIELRENYRIIIIPLKCPIAVFLQSLIIFRMARDIAIRMYEFQGHLMEIKEELENIKKENDELKNQMTVNNLMKTGQKVKIASKFKFILVNDHAKLFKSLGQMQINFKTLSTKGTILLYFVKSISVSRSDHILSGISETLKKQNETLEKLNEAIETLKTKEKNMDKVKISS